MKKIKIALDVDGVLLNFLQTISDFIESHYGLTSMMPFSTTQYNLQFRFEEAHIHAIDFDIIKAEFEKQGHWKTLQSMPETHLFQDLFTNPHLDVYFVTSLPPHLIDDRHHNLCSVFDLHIPKEKIFCVPLGESKKPYIDRLAPDFFVEDNLHNLIECKGPHTSIWIDLNEKLYYDQHNPHEHNFHITHTFNEAAQIFLNYEPTFKNTSKIKSIK